VVPLIHWRLNHETRYPFGERSPNPEWFEPIGFPPPWRDRPWIFGVMVASANGVVAWKRTGPDDDPVRAVLGDDDTSAERIADRRHMRHLRCFGDVAIGAQTLRDQPRLVQTPQEPDEPPAPDLYRFRIAHGLPYQPRSVIYSLFGRLDPEHPVFNTPGLDVIVVGTPIAEATLTARGAADKGVAFVSESVIEPEGLQRAHERLFAEHGVRYLACEGGETVLRALHAAGILDEVFLTVTDAVVDESAHEGVLKILDFEGEGATLIAEGRTSESSGWRFQRWRFNDR
jgi:riboflavin biosynthesis pyrimidine reductase